MKDTFKLTTEYASNLNCLFLNLHNNLASYFQLFQTIFKKCITSKDMSIPQGCTPEFIDIIFIKIDNSLTTQELQDIKHFIRPLRKNKELLPVYLIEDNILNNNIIKIINECYCLDGLLPTPFHKEKVYKFLYRVLKKITIDNELNAYILSLEEGLHIEPNQNPHTKAIIAKKLSNERKQDLRFSQKDKISAVDFINSLDDTIIDKVEHLQIELDSLISLLYDLESSSPQKVIALIPQINIILKDIYILIDTIGSFQVTARAFNSLEEFLMTLTTEQLNDIDKKHLFAMMFIAIINDLEKWIDVIFISQSTEDIHYLDASFSSNILEIEHLFSEHSSTEEEEEDDLEFF